MIEEDTREEAEAEVETDTRSTEEEAHQTQADDWLRNDRCKSIFILMI
jgi:hypothetical protein